MSPPEHTIPSSAQGSSARASHSAQPDAPASERVCAAGGDRGADSCDCGEGPCAAAPARPVDQLAAVQDRLAGWISDLTTLHELTERLTRATTLDDTLNETLRGGADLVGARRGLIVLSPSDGLGPEKTLGLGLGRADIGQIETVTDRSAFYGRLLDGLPEGADDASGHGTDEGHGTEGGAGHGGPDHRTEGGPPGDLAGELAGEGLGEGRPGAARPDEISHPDIASEDDLDPRHREVAARLGYAASYAVPLVATAAAHAHPAADPPGSDRPPGADPRQADAAPGGTATLERPGAAADEPEPLPVTGTAAPEPGPEPADPVPHRHSAPDRRQAEAGHRLGAVVWLYDEPAEPTARQRHLLGLYLRCAAEHLARRLTLSRTETAMAAVQEELLPSRLPRVPGVQLAVRHLSGPRGGGDWYDVLPLPEAALGLSVGGVTGSGPSAIAAMGRLRASLRAYAVMEGEDPVAVLSDLELLMRLTEPARSATALFGYVEPTGRKIVIAGAGHCPPLIVGPRRCAYMETTLSAPLGMLACWEAPSVEVALEPGETLLLYTDGLLRRTGESVDRAFARLQAAALSAAPDVRDVPEALVAHVLARVLGEHGLQEDHEEDVVLLAARF